MIFLSFYSSKSPLSYNIKIKKINLTKTYLNLISLGSVGSLISWPSTPRLFSCQFYGYLWQSGWKRLSFISTQPVIIPTKSKRRSFTTGEGAPLKFPLTFTFFIKTGNYDGGGFHIISPATAAIRCYWLYGSVIPGRIDYCNASFLSLFNLLSRIIPTFPRVIGYLGK